MKNLIFFLIINCFIFKANSIYLYKVKAGNIDYYLINKINTKDTIASFKYFFEEKGKKAILECKTKNRAETFLIVDSIVYKHNKDSFHRFAKYSNIINLMYEISGQKMEFDFYEKIIKYRKKRKFYKGLYIHYYGSYLIPYLYFSGKIIYEYKGIPLFINTMHSSSPNTNEFVNSLVPYNFKFKINLSDQILLESYLKLIVL